MAAERRARREARYHSRRNFSRGSGTVSLVVLCMTVREWRLLVTESTDGATNMAIDEVLWRGRQAGTSPPTVRFFGWDPPTVSLGYGQPLDDSVDVAACRRLGVGLVRRATRSGEHTSELQSPCNLGCRRLLQKKKDRDQPQQGKRATTDDIGEGQR